MGDYPADMNVKPQLVQADRKLDMVASLHEMRKEGWVPFTLGPLYVFGRIPFDIIARFATETKLPIRVSYVEFPNFQIIALNGPYGHMLFSMNDEAYPEFVDWLDTIEVTDVEGGRFFKPLRASAPLMDPFMRTIDAETPTPEVIDVWSISSTSGMILPESHTETLPYPIFKPGEAEELARDEFTRRLPKPVTAPERITFKKLPPHPVVLVRGKQLLKQKGS